jgi:hypothetical protein
VLRAGACARGDKPGAASGPGRSCRLLRQHRAQGRGSRRHDRTLRSCEFIVARLRAASFLLGNGQVAVKIATGRHGVGVAKVCYRRNDLFAMRVQDLDRLDERLRTPFQ